jgi:hypothetical protein
MDLTPELKAQIDNLSHYELLDKIHSAPAGDPIMQGQTGAYWITRWQELGDAHPEQAAADSKALGW